MQEKINDNSIPYFSRDVDIDKEMERCSRLVQVSKGQSLLPIANDSYICLLESGKGEYLLYDESGKDTLLCFVYPGELMGDFQLSPSYPITGVPYYRAKVDSSVRQIPWPQFQNFVKTNWTLVEKIMTQLAIRHSRLTQRVSDMQTKQVKERVILLLLDMARGPEAISHPNGKQISISRQDIGRLVGCSREMAGRSIRLLDEDGLIIADGMKMIIQI